MKKIMAAIILSLSLTTSVYAVTASPSASPDETDATPSATPTSQKLENLKDRLASAATQLRQSQKRAIWGVVKATSVSTITVETKTGDIKTELDDEITVFEFISGKRTKLDTDKIAKGDEVVVFGDYDSTLDLLKGKVIFIQGTLPIHIHGTISETSKKDYTITVTTPEGKSYIVDVETLTKNLVWDKSGGVVKGAFSKLLVGDTVHVVGTPGKKEDRISADRIVDIGNFSGITPTSAPSPTATASPSATPKAK